MRLSRESPDSKGAETMKITSKEILSTPLALALIFTALFLLHLAVLLGPRGGVILH